MSGYPIPIPDHSGQPIPHPLKESLLAWYAENFNNSCKTGTLYLLHSHARFLENDTKSPNPDNGYRGFYCMKVHDNRVRHVVASIDWMRKFRAAVEDGADLSLSTFRAAANNDCKNGNEDGKGNEDRKGNDNREGKDNRKGNENKKGEGELKMDFFWKTKEGKTIEKGKMEKWNAVEKEIRERSAENCPVKAFSRERHAEMLRENERKKAEGMGIFDMGYMENGREIVTVRPELRAEAGEFVPSKSLNPMSTEFVPRSILPPTPPRSPKSDDQIPADGFVLEAGEIEAFGFLALGELAEEFVDFCPFDGEKTVGAERGCKVE
jgi:hypothetical protein